MATAPGSQRTNRTFKAPPTRARAYYFYLMGVVAAIAAAAVLVFAQAQAQTTALLNASADTNKDDALQLDEFVVALNQALARPLSRIHPG